MIAPPLTYGEFAEGTGYYLDNPTASQARAAIDFNDDGRAQGWGIYEIGLIEDWLNVSLS